MNDITSAMQKAGIKLPHPRERMWTYIRDNPGTTHIKVRSGLRLSESAASQAGLALAEAGLVLVEKLSLRNKEGRGVRGKAYTINPKFPEYIDGAKTSISKNASRGREQAAAPPKPTDPIVVVPCDTVELRLPTALVENLRGMATYLETIWGFKPTLIQTIAYGTKKYFPGAAS